MLRIGISLGNEPHPSLRDTFPLKRGRPDFQVNNIFQKEEADPHESASSNFILHFGQNIQKLAEILFAEGHFFFIDNKAGNAHHIVAFF